MATGRWCPPNTRSAARTSALGAECHATPKNRRASRIAASRGSQVNSKSGCRFAPSKSARHANRVGNYPRYSRTYRGARSAGRRDRRAVGAPRCGHRAPARLRCARGLGQWISLLYRLAELARGTRSWGSEGESPSGARPRDTAAPRPRARQRRALVLEVRALTRVATPETQERLLAVGHAGTAEHVERTRTGLAACGSDRGDAG